MGFILFLAIPRMWEISGMEVKGAARRLAGTIRYVYNLSTSHKAKYRICFDFETNRYTIEYLYKTIPALEDEENDDDDGDGINDHRDNCPLIPNPEQEDDDDDNIGNVCEKTYEGEYLPAADRIAKPQSLPDHVKFLDIYTSSAGTVEEERACCYFFPDGFVEKTMIHLEDTKENRYTLDVMPLTGRVKIYEEHIEAPVE